MVCAGASGRAATCRALLALLTVLVLGLAVAPAHAQMPPGQGPRFPYLGPTQPFPEAESTMRTPGALPPGRTQGCHWNLAGIWEGRGRQTDPVPNTYTTRLVIRQAGSYVLAEQPADGITYYGVCSGDRLELDAYSGDIYIGVQTGTISANGRRIESTWVLYRPDYAAGYETLNAVGRTSR